MFKKEQFVHNASIFHWKKIQTNQAYFKFGTDTPSTHVINKSTKPITVKSKSSSLSENPKPTATPATTPNATDTTTGLPKKSTISHTTVTAVTAVTAVTPTDTNNSNNTKTTNDPTKIKSLQSEPGNYAHGQTFHTVWIESRVTTH